MQHLEAMQEKLERAATVIGDVLTLTAEFNERRAILRQRASSEAPDVSRLLLAAAQIRRVTAWTIPSPESTLTAAVFLYGYRLRVSFADGVSGELELAEEFWHDYYGISMNVEVFRSFHLDTDSNAIYWSDRQFVTGETARRVFCDHSPKPTATG